MFSRRAVPASIRAPPSRPRADARSLYRDYFSIQRILSHPLQYLKTVARYRSFRDLDWPLLVITLIISSLGVLQIYSATHDTKWHSDWWKQIIWIAVGLGLMWLAMS